MYSELFITEDGSHTLFVPTIDECYHSTHGAVQESQHIFINSGFKQCNKSEIRVLEIGFGTGLNTFLTLMEARKTGKKVYYTSLEKYPVEVEQALQLNYVENRFSDLQKEFELLHTSPWNTKVQITAFFLLQKMQADFTIFDLDEMYDVIYFDAFSPEKQPEMWSEALFEKIYSHCSPEAILTTYCSKGIVRRVMQTAGFLVDRLPGPPGKREILRSRRI
jgi:tRNA U34 5-methylaminomethyl-2-thiouridine-forming methyltransferase MnmC